MAALVAIVMPRRTVIAALLSLLVARAHAEEPVYATTWSQEALEGIEQVHESPELRTLRLAEEELFAKGPDDPPEPFDPGCADGPDPSDRDPATEKGPPPRFVRPEGTVDLAFLKGVKLPGVPVRWDKRVLEYLLFFKDDPRGRELAASWLARRERYGPQIRRMLSEHSLPVDVQYVAMIESGYDPVARSAADAHGMWQFMAQPAIQYGLRIDHWTDERLDPERATGAAARFLRDLYERFGSWELSFAAYNMGYGGLLRAIRKYNTNDYWTLSHLEAGLPFETSLYVAKITAMAIVANNPGLFGFGKVKQDGVRPPAKVDVPAGTPLSQIATAAGISLEALRAANPHLKQARVPPGEPAVNVYVPRDVQVRFTQHFQKPTSLPVAYAVRLGESLDDIARRANTSTSKLRELNGLTDNARIMPGLALLLPASARPTADLLEPLVATVPARDFHYGERKRVFYRVGPEDTQSSVARFFDVSSGELAMWNDLHAAAALQPGMLLQLFVQPTLDLSQAVVYLPNEVRILTVGSDAFFAYHEQQRGRTRVRYRVQPGDSVMKLAERFSLSPGSLGRINQFPSTRELKAGERLIIYVPHDDKHAGELAKLEQKGVIERLGSADDATSTRDAQRPAVPARAAKYLADDVPELPEQEGVVPREPKREAPITPPSDKPRAKVAAPTKPADKAPKTRPAQRAPRTP